MHSNLTPFIAAQHVADLHEQAARYRTEHPSQPKPQPQPRQVRRHWNPLRLAVHSVHLRRTA